MKNENMTPAEAMETVHFRPKTVLDEMRLLKWEFKAYAKADVPIRDPHTAMTNIAYRLAQVGNKIAQTGDQDTSRVFKNVVEICRKKARNDAGVARTLAIIANNFDLAA